MNYFYKKKTQTSDMEEPDLCILFSQQPLLLHPCRDSEVLDLQLVTLGNLDFVTWAGQTSN